MGLCGSYGPCTESSTSTCSEPGTFRLHPRLCLTSTRTSTYPLRVVLRSGERAPHNPCSPQRLLQHEGTNFDFERGLRCGYSNARLSVGLTRNAEPALQCRSEGWCGRLLPEALLVHHCQGPASASAVNKPRPLRRNGRAQRHSCVHSPARTRTARPFQPVETTRRNASTKTTSCSAR